MLAWNLLDEVNRDLLLAVAPWVGHPNAGESGVRVMSFDTWDVRFLESVAPWSFSGGNMARITVVLLWIPTSTSEGGSNGFTPGTGSTRASHLLTKVWTWQTPSDRWTEKHTEDVIQPRLREIDRFFFITRRRRLLTEVLAPDGIASGLAQVGLLMGDKNAPDEFGAVFQGAIDTWQASVTKKNGGIFGRSPYEDVERSCGVTLFADDVF